MCDGNGEPCDYLCGGAGCGHCGGSSCDDGAVTKAENALDFAKEADEKLKKKAMETRDLLSDVSSYYWAYSWQNIIPHLIYDKSVDTIGKT